MSIFHPSIFFVHYQTVFRILKLNLIDHFSIRRFLFTTVFLYLHTLGVIFLSFGRILDEIFFFGYRKVDLSSPMFIISNPRCGTTFLHRLLCLDKNYTFTLLYHTIMPCVTYIKLIQGVAWLDSKIGGLLEKLFQWLDKVFFGGWADIHPMGFGQSEEDEALFTLAAFTPALVLLSPWAHELKYLNFLDKVDEKTKEKMKKFYISSLKRIIYATNSDKKLLMKNVFSTGRLNFILDCFPDAKIIYPVRHPYNAVPSVISMFTAPWKIHSPELKEDSKDRRAFGQIAVDYYAYLFEQKDQIDSKNFIVSRYDDLIAAPKEQVKKLYAHFGIEVSPAYEEALSQLGQRSKKYKSKHSYSLAQYGYTKEMISEPLDAFMTTYEFDKEEDV